MFDTEPIGQTDNGSHIAGVLDTVERKCQGTSGLCVGQTPLREAEDGKHFLRILLETHLAQFLVRHLNPFTWRQCFLHGEPFRRGDQQATREGGQHIAHQLRAFCYKRLLLVPVLFQLQRADVFLFVFANHIM